VVAPKFGILKETVIHQHNGLLFEPNSVDDLAANLQLMIQDPALRSKMALGGVKTVQGYDIRAVAPKMAEIYRSVLTRQTEE